MGRTPVMGIDFCCQRNMSKQGLGEVDFKSSSGNTFHLKITKKTKVDPAVTCVLVETNKAKTSDGIVGYYNEAGMLDVHGSHAGQAIKLNGLLEEGKMEISAGHPATISCVHGGTYTWTVTEALKWTPTTE